MQDFSKFNKKEESVNLPAADFEIGKKIRLVANLSVYEPGEVFTVVNESTPTFSTSTWGIGETYLKDNNGSVLLIKGNKKFINEIFENVKEPPVKIVEEKKEDTIPFLVEDLKKSLKEELVKQLKEEIKPLPGLKGDKGDRGMPGMPGDKGDKGDVGERGETGWTGWPGDKGEQGVQGEKGEKGDKGDQGERGEKGDRGEPGSQGDKGEKGDAGDKGEKGDKGERGDRGDVGQQGEQGERGEKGDQGEKGDKGDQGEPGLSGRDGKDGIAGEKGEKGDKGDTGERGERGEKGDKGDTGDSGIVSVSYPLAYEDVNKHLSLDTKFLEDYNNKITSEISKHAYGSGGGGNLDLYIENEKAVKNLRSINFTGNLVNVTPDGNKATVDVSIVPARYGSFYDTTNQTAPNINGVYPVSFNTTSGSNGVTLDTNNDSIRIEYNGIYNVQFSVQFANSSATEYHAHIFFRKNGQNIPDTNSEFTIPSKHGSHNGQLILAANFIFELNAGDYIQMMWHPDNTAVTLETIPADVSPAMPVSPSAILTVVELTNGGPIGPAGDDGRGISSSTINDDGELILTYTDNTTQNVGVVVGNVAALDGGTF